MLTKSGQGQPREVRDKSRQNKFDVWEWSVLNRKEEAKDQVTRQPILAEGLLHPTQRYQSARKTRSQSVDGRGFQKKCFVSLAPWALPCRHPIQIDA